MSPVAARRCQWPRDVAIERDGSGGDAHQAPQTTLRTQRLKQA